MGSGAIQTLPPIDNLQSSRLIRKYLIGSFPPRFYLLGLYRASGISLKLGSFMLSLVWCIQGILSQVLDIYHGGHDVTRARSESGKSPR